MHSQSGYGTTRLDSENFQEVENAALSSLGDASYKGQAKVGELLSILPKELLSEILQWCCASYVNRYNASPMAPLMLSHVCRMWRTIAFATPELWTYVSLGAPKTNVESATELMLLWVENAKQCPVLVDMDLTVYASFKKPDVIMPVVREMVELAMQKKGNVIGAIDEEALARHLRVSVQPSVLVKFPYMSEEYFWTNEEMPFESGPPRGAFRLRVATKPSFILGMDGSRSFARYLVHLNLRSESNSMALTMEEALGIVRVFQNLEHLEITVGYPEEASDGDGRRYNHDKLKTLSLMWIDGQEPSVLIDSIAAPNLENLELDGELPPADFMIGNSWTCLRNFLRVTSPPLRTLNLYKLRAEDVDLIGCLSVINSCGSLDRLWLDECVLDESTVRSFTEATHMGVEGAQRVLEGLTTLGLVRCQINGARDWYRSLVTSGLVWSVTKLNGLYIRDCDIHPGIHETLHFLRCRYEAGAYIDLD